MERVFRKLRLQRNSHPSIESKSPHILNIYIEGNIEQWDYRDIMEVSLQNYRDIIESKVPIFLICIEGKYMDRGIIGSISLQNKTYKNKKQ